jgi:O-antigen ligase
VQTWICAAILLLHGVQVRMLPREERRIQTLGLIFIPFFLYLCVHVAFLSPMSWRAEEELLILAQGGVVFWVAIHNIRNRGTIRLFMGIFALAAVASLFAAGHQVFRDPTWLPLDRMQMEKFHGRGSGTFGAPNNFGAFMGLALALSFYFAAVRRFPLSVRILCGYLTLLFFAGLILSGSRGSWIAFACVLILTPFFISGNPVVRAAASAFVIIGMAAGGWLLYTTVPLVETRIDMAIAQGGESSRKFMWDSAWAIFQDHPATGSGLASFEMFFEMYRDPSYQMSPLYAHNDYLNTLSDVGVIGFLLFFGPVTGLLWLGWRAWRNHPFRSARRRIRMPHDKCILGGLLLCLFGFAVHLFVDFHLKIPALLFSVAVFLGWIVRFSAGSGTPLPGRRSVEVLWTAMMILAAGLIASRGTVAFVAAGYYQRGDEWMRRYLEDPAEWEENTELLPAVIDELHRAVAWNPNHGFAWNQLSLAIMESYYQVGGDRVGFGRRGRKAATLALAASDHIWSAHAHYGMALLMERAPREEARRHFERAVELGPSKAAGWLYLGEFLALDPGAEREALDALNRVLGLDPSNKRAIKLVERIQTP